MRATMTFAAAVALIAGAAHAETRRFPLAGFDRIGLAGPHDMTVVTGQQFSVRAEGAGTDLDRLEVRIDGGTLEIGDKQRWTSGWKWGDRKVRFIVTMPELRGVSLAGSGSLTADRAGGDRFEGEVAGSGQLRIGTLDARAVSFSIAGSGSARVAGRCGSAQYEIAGSGSVLAAGLRCERLDVSIAGSGGVEAFASRAAAVSIMGSGNVRVAGGARCSVSKMGSGKVSCPG